MLDLRLAIMGWLAIAFGWAMTTHASPPSPPTASTAPAGQPARDGLGDFGDERVLRRDDITLAFSPRVGRVVWFGKTGGENLLWINPKQSDQPHHGRRNPYRNVGGDKIWAAPQPLWPRLLEGGDEWPPDGVIDGQPWEILEHDDDKLVVESRFSPGWGVRVRRSFELVALQSSDPKKSRPEQVEAAEHAVIITTTLARPRPHPGLVHAWSVTQVKPPQRVILDALRPTRDGEPWLPMMGDDAFAQGIEPVEDAMHGPAVSWTPTRNEHGQFHSGKAGTFGRSIRAFYGDLVFVQEHRQSHTAAYADGSNVQLYVAEQHYVELELLSPTRHLQADESMSHTVRWSLRSVE